MVERIGKEEGLLLAREEADYYPETSFSPEESLDALEKAEVFLSGVARFIEPE
jgi:hypothetical protein